MVGLLFYFITSSDSGSFTVDMIAANGEANPPKIQTVLWSFTEGLCAIAPDDFYDVSEKASEEKEA